MPTATSSTTSTAWARRVLARVPGRA